MEKYYENSEPENRMGKSYIFLSGLVSDFGKAKFFKNWPHVIYTIQAFLREAPTKGHEGRAKGLSWLAREVAAQRSGHTRAD